ncbi:hypothetical protein CERSUDRAFT_100570 [Gelatoporia subvermispora B]|uniref:Major facilitator superfamily (MFS) profile domain-containing protein n=1 Tax=Ceriporiopsis subvermispora (strain B) TaxID=914234 RepID=M2QGQ2_CERS8|nr:hypothetical protein CERSUDRAFT_100570 [Gelatoporia subvermispora B]
MKLAMTTALPTIVQDLGGTQFLWVPDAYGLTAAALVPLSGNLAEIFGRRPTMLITLFFFAAGSAIGGAAQNMTMLIAGRALQGVGGGGIYAMTQIILSDMVTLKERGKYSGLYGFVFAIAGGIAPVIGGGLAKPKKWRWLLWLNIPISAVAFFLFLLFCNLPTPSGTMRQKLKRIDVVGQTLVIGATTACIIALVWGGVIFSWSSAHVIVPLVIGFAGLLVFVVYETSFCSDPVLPRQIISNRTTISGYIQIFMIAFIFSDIIYFFPNYYQACKDASPVASGVDVFVVGFTVAPVSVISGATVAALKRYRPQMWLGWVLTIIGFGLLTTVRENTSRSATLGFQSIVGVGLGMSYYTAFFPVLAPLPVWGLSVGGTILQNGLQSKLPPAFSQRFDSSSGLAYAIVPQIPGLPQPLKDQVRAAFAQSLAHNWIMLTALSAVGLAASLMMKSLPLHTDRDERWAIPEDAKKMSDDALTVQGGIEKANGEGTESIS